MDLLRWLRAEWDRATGFGLVGLGATVLLLGYLGVARSPYVAEQLAYIISGGVGGLFLLGCGATLLISADLHDEWRKLDLIEAAIHRARAGDEPAGSPSTSPGAVLPQAGSPPSPPRSGSAVPLASPFRPQRESQQHRSSPVAADNSARWARRGAGATAAALGVAGIVVALSWDRAAGTSDPRPGIAALTTAAIGLTLAGVALMTCTLWQRRQGRDRQARLLVPNMLAFAVRPRQLTDMSPRGPADADEVLTAPGLSRFHRRGCPALSGVAGAAPVSGHPLESGLRPCGLCWTE